MSDIKYKKRLTLSVYLFLTALAFIFALIGLHYFHSSQPTQSLFINLSSEIAGVVIIFLIVKHLFLLSAESDINSELKFIKDGINEKFNPLFWSQSFDDKFDLSYYLHNVNSIYILGLNFKAYLKKYRKEFAKFIRDGKNIKILLTDIDSPAGDLVRNVSYSNEDWLSEGRRDVINSINEIKGEILKSGKAKGSIELKVIPWLFSCSMIMLNYRKKGIIAKITINPLSINLPFGDIQEHISFILTQEQYSKEFNYYKKNFDLLWDDDKSKTIANISLK